MTPRNATIDAPENLDSRGHKMAAEPTALYTAWLGRYPILSIEDGLGESAPDRTGM